MKTFTIQEFVFALISGFIAVPVCTINFDYAINSWQEKIDRISAYLMFLYEWFGYLFKCLTDFLFDIRFSFGSSIACHRTIFRFPALFVGKKFFATMNTGIQPLNTCSTFPITDSVAMSYGGLYGKPFTTNWTNFCYLWRIFTLTFATAKVSAMLFRARWTKIKAHITLLTYKVFPIALTLGWLKSYFGISRGHDAIISYLCNQGYADAGLP